MDGGVGTLGILKFHIPKALGLAGGVVPSQSNAALDNLAARNECIVYGGLVGLVRQIPHKDDATTIRLISGLAPSCTRLHRGSCGAGSRSIWLLDGYVSFAQVQAIQFLHSLDPRLCRIKHNMAKASQSSSVLPSANT